MTNRAFIAGERYTMADIVAQTTFDFARFIGVHIPDDCKTLRDWYARVSARPSATLNIPQSLIDQARDATR